ncbi:VOC family protein [Kribbella sp. NPDC051718]|uniref:VOC family protein n=1 Tax=Kribbella sp. NPDC051718 TaxID=3155168 RepID=UPI00344A145C
MVFWQLTIDANDPERLALFWQEALGWVRTPPSPPASDAEDEPTWWAHYRGRLDGQAAFTDRLFDPAGAGPPLWFQKVPEAKAGKNRLHLDLYPTGRDNSLTQERRIELVDSKAAELVAIGATIEHRIRDDNPADPEYYLILQDPEGNEFCIG